MQKSSHSQYIIKYHVVWLTKYRYNVLTGRIASRVRELIRNICHALNVDIVSGSIGKNYVHLLVVCPPTLPVSKLVQLLKGKTSKVVQEEFKELENKYWGRRLWASGYLCISVGYVDEKIIKSYITKGGLIKEKSDLSR